MPNVIKGATSAINTTVIEDVAKLPVGSRGTQLVIMTKNVARVINGRKFTGHALDQMQSSGIISPTAVIDAIVNATSSFAGKLPGTMVYVKDKLRVVTSAAGDVITVMWHIR
jgi:hypothetical protein